MSIVNHGLKELAATIETLEDEGNTITEISTSTGGSCSSHGLTAEFSIAIPLPISKHHGGDSVFDATEAVVREDGSVLVSFEGEITGHDIETASTNGALVQQSAGGKGELPPHRDPEALQKAYEECDTFVEMKRALGTDVTPEAVRQQMVKQGIHEVTEDDSAETECDSVQEVSIADTADTPAPGDSLEDGGQQGGTKSSEIFVSDGGFPSDLTVPELKEIVKSSESLYEVSKQLSTSLDETREMLKRLNLLDFVTGRLSTKGEQTVTDEEIDRRIRASSATQV